MDCQKCQDLLSDYLDGTLTAPQEHARLDAHLRECAECTSVRDDLRAIMGVCREQRGQYYSVPNERALWLRISNVIESEESARQSGAAAGGTVAKKTEGSWRDLLNKRWEFSLPQMAMTLGAIIVAVALGTAVGLRLTLRPNLDFDRQASSPLIPKNIVREENVSTPDNLVLPQNASMEYWNRRVQERKARWSPQTREAFDRNMDVIDMTVNDAMTGLRQNPHDNVSEQMLNEALKDKMELLKEFSEY